MPQKQFTRPQTDKNSPLRATVTQSSAVAVEAFTFETDGRAEIETLHDLAAVGADLGQDLFLFDSTFLFQNMARGAFVEILWHGNIIWSKC